MLKEQRAFPYRTERQGNIASRYFFPIDCCRCDWHFDFESRGVLPDTVIAKKLQNLGWTVAKRREHDICPRCSGVEPKNKLARHFRVIENGSPVPSASEFVDAQASEQSKDTEAMLDKHFPMSNTAEPKAKPQSNNHVTVQTGISPELTLLLIQSIASIAPAFAQVQKGLGDVSAAIELLADQQTQLITAVSRIVPSIEKMNENLATRLVELVRTASRFELPEVVMPPVETLRLTEEQYERLSKAGFPHDVIETYLRGEAEPQEGATESPRDEPEVDHANDDSLWSRNDLVRVSVTKPASAQGLGYCTFLRLPPKLLEGTNIQCGTKFTASVTNGELRFLVDPKGKITLRKQSAQTLQLVTFAVGDTRHYQGVVDYRLDDTGIIVRKAHG